MANATTTTLGEIKLAGDIAGSNNALLPELTATGVTPGVYAVPNITVDAKGRITAANGMNSATVAALLGDATTGAKGVVQIGTNIDVTAGVISVATATTGVKGLMQVGTGLSVTGGVVSVTTPVVDATDTTKGVVQIGTGLSVTAGVVSVTTPVADATDITKGIMQVGAGLSVTAGVVSVTNPVIDATTTTKGTVQVGTNIDVAAGVISVATATTGVKGLMQVGSGLSVTAGVVSVPDATAAVKGVVQVGTNIDVTAGVISVATASGTATLGLVKSANTANITITAGAIDVGVNIVKKDTQNTFTKSQAVALSTITYGATVTPDFSLSNVFYLAATGNFTLAAPTNIVAGGTYHIIVKQDATGSRLITWNSVYKFRGYNPILSVTPNYVDIISCVAQSGTFLITELQKGYI